MKTALLISLILAVTAGAVFAAETHMTIQTNTTIRIDPVTGQVKGDTQTQIKGIKKRDEAPPDAINTQAAGASSANTGTVSTPVTLTTSTDPNTVSSPVSMGTATNSTTGTTPVSVSSPTVSNTGTTATGATPPANQSATCPAAQVSGGQQN